MRRGTSWNRTILPRSSAGVRVGRYPFGITLSPDDGTLFVTHVGVFEYTHLRPENPTGDPNLDYPLCYPGAGYPDETGQNRLIEITKVDPRNLPDDLRDPNGIRCGYVPSDRTYTVPGLGSPNAPQSSSVYVLDVSNPASPRQQKIVKTGPKVGDVENAGNGRGQGNPESGLVVYSGSHPNAVVVGPRAIYVANGNNDSISILDPATYEERRADRAVAASRPRPDVEGRPAGRVGVEPRRANPVCGAGGHQRDRRRQAQRDERAAGGLHPDRLVAERRAGQRRWQHPLRRECTRPRRHAQPQRRRLAQEQRDRDREHHPGSVAATARVIYRARLRQQRLRRRSTASRPDQSDPEPARKAERSDQARRSSSTRRMRRTI